MKNTNVIIFVIVLLSAINSNAFTDFEVTKVTDTTVSFAWDDNSSREDSYFLCKDTIYDCIGLDNDTERYVQTELTPASSYGFILMNSIDGTVVQYKSLKVKTTQNFLVPVISYLLDDASNISTSTIKKTGQTKSYDNDGVENSNIQDDGFYQKGVAPQYTRANEIVTDHITGLMWQDDSDAYSVEKEWEAAKQHCVDLTLDGQSDWRLPTSRELSSIIDYSKSYAIDSIFTYTDSDFDPTMGYWTSTTTNFITSFAFEVTFSGGSVHYNQKSSEFYVRCVRDEQ